MSQSQDDPEDPEHLEHRRQVMIQKLTDKLAAPVEEAHPLACSRCADGQHDRCKQDVYHPLAKTRVPCGCAMREVDQHP